MPERSPSVEGTKARGKEGGERKTWKYAIVDMADRFERYIDRCRERQRENISVKKRDESILHMAHTRRCKSTTENL